MYNLEKFFVYIVVTVLVTIACLAIVGAPVTTIIGGIIAAASPTSPSKMAIILTAVGIVIDVALLLVTLPLLYYYAVRHLSAEETYAIDYGGNKHRARIAVGTTVFAIAAIMMALVIIIATGYCADPYDGVSVGIFTIIAGTISFSCTLCAILMQAKW